VERRIRPEDRHRAEFKAKNGWNLFLKQSAHFSDCC
jgi:hypothetical protein